MMIFLTAFILAATLVGVWLVWQIVLEIYRMWQDNVKIPTPHSDKTGTG